eukprot:CAMPEP_0183716370 /NCGR_PEP_ID=MMETSP0737-20130205/10321_1 /TAXON_ID=385413 /ORGANISM="Thalassiosira miniscula, Strain CCMP1093" /LENGTH=280 /DNA_ID=CAMNT_0025945637 /DNA_START=93 /DNA_END=932 /DNA_ORIENTATION=-
MSAKAALKTQVSTLNVNRITIDHDIFNNIDLAISEAVVRKLSSMDQDGDGRVSSEELTLALIETAQAFSKKQQSTVRMKYGIGGLVGLVFLLGLSGFATAYVAAKLTQVLKVAPDGTLVNSHGGGPVKTIPHGVSLGSLDHVDGADLFSRHLEFQDTSIYSCLSDEEIDILWDNSFTSPVIVQMSENETHAIQTSEGIENATGFTIVTPWGDYYEGTYDDEKCPIDEVASAHDHNRKLKLKGSGKPGALKLQGTRRKLESNLESKKMAKFSKKKKGCCKW